MKPLIALLTDQTTFALFYGSMIALITLWAMALLTRRVRRLTNHLEGLQQELRIVNEALRTLEHAGVKREAASIDGVLGVTPSASTPSHQQLETRFARPNPPLDMASLEQRLAAAGELGAGEPRVPPPADSKPSVSSMAAQEPRHRVSAAPLPPGAHRPAVVKTADPSSMKLAVAKAAEAQDSGTKPAATKVEEGSGAKAAPPS